MKTVFYQSAQEAVNLIKDGDQVFIHAAPMTPDILIDALSERYQELNHVEIVQIITTDKALYTQEPYNSSFTVRSLFTGSNVRKTVNSDRGHFTPVFLSQMPRVFNDKIVPIDVALIQVSPPDKHGYCSLGVSVETSLAAIKNAKKIIAEVNPQVPRVFGDGYIHVNTIDAFVESDHPIMEVPVAQATEIDIAIGKNIAGLIEDGSALQIGIGAVPNMVLENLQNHKDLGIHTEIFSDGILDLVEKGVINGKNKAIDKGKIVATFLFGSKRLYDFVDNNPKVWLRPCDYTNDPCNIRKNPKAVAINSAIEIDLTGQVCAETIGDYQYSGVGGQLDFTLGTSMSPGGKPIFGLPSTTRSGKTKIVPRLTHGAGVTTTRAHVHWVATEYGAVNLFGKSTKERAKALISIAHPSHREHLECQAKEILKF